MTLLTGYVNGIRIFSSAMVKAGTTAGNRAKVFFSHIIDKEKVGGGKFSPTPTFSAIFQNYNVEDSSK